jgi:hypothetical protein
MTDEDHSGQTAEDAFGVALPPNARIGYLTFDAAKRCVSVGLADGGAERSIAANDVRSLFGARIRHVSVTNLPPKAQGPALSTAVLLATTGLPQGLLNPSTRAGREVVSEDLYYAIALRIEKLPELWYLNASSFNFRRALGDDATYSTDLNVRIFVRKLAQFAPEAVRDGFVTAVLQGSPLPPPMDSLLAFFRIVAR